MALSGMFVSGYAGNTFAPQCKIPSQILVYYMFGM